ncbi:MAG: type ISP restriction/modification enzyme [Bacteroides sp.]
MTPLQNYLKRLAQEYKTGVTTEHSLRPALVEFLKETDELRKFTIINEPKRIACGAPDIVLLQKVSIPVAYIETKDIGDPDLRGVKQNKEQFSRYKQGLDCVVFTDFLRFLLYRGNECLLEVRIAEQNGNTLSILHDAEQRIAELLAQLRDAQPAPISSAKKLALLMAGKAQLLARSIREVLKDKESDAGQELQQQFDRMRDVLMSTVEEDEFADWYAQTIVYALFAARYHEQNPDTFSRQKAAELIPQSNPFLRKLFQRIGVYDLDTRVAWIIDDLVGVFGATDVRTLLDTAKSTAHDPIMLFYEDFLTAYDPARRKARGVYYTPSPVVAFIVRAVDELLQRDFGLRDGLADRTTLQSKRGNPVHRLQILDPATGTGTFLVEVVRAIYRKFAGQQGVWNDYVRDHLLPRLHGYEILMAPYAMAHLNLEYVFRETGATNLGSARYGIYLTNTLENKRFDGNLFSPIDQEAQAANLLKNSMRVMVMLGNPPYNVSSSNKSKWIENLMLTYKADLNEKNIKPLSDDYIKFIRYAQYQIEEQTGEGIVAFITNNRFLDGVIHRQMRKELLRVFDEIYILNLHGNSRMKEKAPDGGKDENVFAIQAGVSINIFVKHKEPKQEQAKLFYHELYGQRQEKFAALSKLNLNSAYWKELPPVAPYYFFIEKDFQLAAKYRAGFAVDALFVEHVAGMTTTRDELLVQFSFRACCELKEDFLQLREGDLLNKYKLNPDTRDWSLQNAITDVKAAEQEKAVEIIAYSYRPYDKRYILYTGKTGGIAARPRFRLLGALLSINNYALCATRIVAAFAEYHHSFVSKDLIDISTISNKTSEIATAFLLYKLPDGWNYTPAELIAGKTRNGKPIELELNMRPEILAKLSEAVGKPVKGEEVFDYVYGVLHDKEYREKYFEFLKIEYPRIPYPKDKTEYQHYVAIGERLRRLHLMDETLNLPLITTFDVAGTNLIEKVEYDNGKVWINDTQYFNHVPQEVWDHYVGSYQPARLWLQKRKGRTLDFDDVNWYLRVCATIYAEITEMG